MHQLVPSTLIGTQMQGQSILALESFASSDTLDRPRWPCCHFGTQVPWWNILCTIKQCRLCHGTVLQSIDSIWMKFGNFLLHKGQLGGGCCFEFGARFGFGGNDLMILSPFTCNCMLPSLKVGNGIDHIKKGLVLSTCTCTVVLVQYEYSSTSTVQYIIVGVTQVSY